MTTKPLDAYLPIKELLVDGVVQPYTRKLDIDGARFTLTLQDDGETSTLSTTNEGDVPLDEASFGTQHTVKARLLWLHTTNATPTLFVDPATTDVLQVVAGTAADLVGTVIGKKRASVDIYRADVRGTISNNLPTVSTLSGDSITNEVKTGALAAASVTIGTDGAGAFEIEVTGVAATDIDWSFAV